MKNIINQTLLFGIILLTFSSCVKDNIENTNIENFDLLWKILDENYSGFQVRNVDWDAVRDTYRPQALAAQSEEDLFIICSRMINNELQDGHNTLMDSDGEEYIGDFEPLVVEDIYDFELVKSKYIEEGYESINVDETFDHIFGNIKDENIGYLFLKEMEDIVGGWESQMDEFIENIKDTDGLIIDIRVNGGGYTPIGLYIADRFAATEEHVLNIQTKNGPAHDEFDDPSPIYISPAGSTQYTKPIVILTDEFTGSNAEDLTIKLKSQDHVTLMGNTTDGIFSNISLQKYLPNGWSVAFSHQLYTYPDGTSPEGVGVPPDVPVSYMAEDWRGGTDKVLEAAIEFLK